MPKSNYPNKLDTSVEIPAVRDNITEISSDVINSLRSAILQIERTLGINPQGASGNTVASRLARLTDDNGNLLKSAITQANILSGPILDSDVSNVAAIRESKLRLNFPTQLLQDEISIINGQLDDIITRLDEIAAQFVVHVHPDATDRHKGKSITIESAVVSASTTGTSSLAAGTTQSVFEEIYNSHINYSGANISETNNSHLANQIFFDNENLEAIVPSDDVQGAISDLAQINNVGLRNSIINLSSNGRVRTGSVEDEFEGNERGNRLLADTDATYTQSGGDSTTTFTLSATVAPLDTIEPFDVLVMSGSISTTDNKDYQIKSVNLDGSGNLISVETFGGPFFENAEPVTIGIFKNIYTSYNQNGLNCVSRPRVNRTNTPDVQAANPNSATVVSSDILPAKITSTVNTFNISIDGGADLTIETFDSTVSIQTLDSIVNKINEQAVDQHLNIMAYKVRVSGCYELAIAHNLPNSNDDIINRTIEIKAGSSNDGTTELGLSSYLDTEIEGSSNNIFNINGLLLNSFGLVQQLLNTEISLVSSTNTLVLTNGDAADLGIRNGDSLVVTGSDDSSDDGTFRIRSFTGDTITVDDSSFTFSGALGSTSSVHIIRNSALVGELTFTEAISTKGSILFDMFLTDEGDVNYKKRMEIDGELLEGPFLAAVIDTSRNFILEGQTATINVDTNGYGYLTGPSGQPGESIYIAADGIYKLFAQDRLSFVTIKVRASGPPAPTAQSVTLYGFNEISQSNLHLCRGTFATSLGRVLGEGVDIGIPSVVDKRTSGTVDQTIISESLLEKYIEGPRNELRGSGVIRGCGISNAQSLPAGGPTTYQTFGLDAGIIVVNGIRYELQGIEEFRVNTDQDFYIAIDGTGCVLAGEPITNPETGSGLISPFTNQNVAHLAFVEESTNSITDLRLFVDHLDYKVIGDIKISNDERFGHFTDIKSGVDYARRFTEMFPELSTPSIFIDEGTHLISENILIDFDLAIRGAGPNTVIQKTGTLAQGMTPIGSVLPVIGDIDLASSAFLVGGGPDSNADNITNGVTFSDFTYRVSDDLTGVGIAIAFAQIATDATLADLSTDSAFRVDNVSFIGIDSISNANEIGEYAIVVGRAAAASPYTPRTAAFAIGNLRVSNCFFRRMGVELGPIRFIGGNLLSIFSGIIMHGNVSWSTSPTLSHATMGILEDPPNITLTGVIEASNVVV